MKHTEHDELLSEFLTGDELSEFRRASLELGLKALAARRTRRAVVRTCGGCSLLLALAGVVLLPWLPGRWTGRRSVASPPDVVSAPAPAKASGVKFISDDELMALFPDRAVALIGKPGHQQFVFLDVPR
jgi:hypothetical protein